MVENINQALIISFLGLSTIPYSFYNMKACYQVFDPSAYIHDISRVGIGPIHSLKNYNDDVFSTCLTFYNIYLFLYDKKTGYSIGSNISKDLDNIKEYADFFSGEENVSLNNLSFFNLKESLGLIIKKQRLALHLVRGSSYFDLQFLFGYELKLMKLKHNKLEKPFSKDFRGNKIRTSRLYDSTDKIKPDDKNVYV